MDIKLENNSKRDALMDIFKGIVIFLIVLGHLDWPIWFLRMFIGFHISLFFMFTGFFILQSIKKYNFRDYVKVKFSQIMRVYIACVILQFGFMLVADIYNQRNYLDLRFQNFLAVLLTGSNQDFRIAGYSSYLWFLPIFFIFLIFLFYIFKKNQRNLFWIFITVYFLSIITVGLVNAQVYDTLYFPYNLDKIFVVLTLGFMGFYLKRLRNFLEEHSKALLLASFLIIVIGFNIWQISLRHMQMPSVSLFYLYSLVGFIFVFSLSKFIIQNDSLDGLKRTLTFWGENTLGIYILHAFINQWVPFYIGVNFSQNIMFNILMLVFTFSLYSIFHKFLKISNPQF